MEYFHLGSVKESMKSVICAIAALLMTEGPPVFGQTLTSNLKRQAAFIFQKRGTNYFPMGTCFSVGVPNQKSTNGGRFQYLVTAKHVLMATNGQKYSNLWVRLNRWQGGLEMLLLYQNNYQPPLYTNNDHSVDVAIMSWVPDQTKYDFPMIASEEFAKQNAVSSGRIREGDPVIFPGLFLSYYGNSNNVPVLRFGHVSILPTERIDWMGNQCELYLIESTCFGGNSGSPVFVRHSLERDGSVTVGNQDIFLAGLLIGYFDVFRPLQSIDVISIQASGNNSGISAVVPAHRIYEILFSPEMKKSRGEL